jgi:hypothetical protein
MSTAKKNKRVDVTEEGDKHKKLKHEYVPIDIKKEVRDLSNVNTLGQGLSMERFSDVIRYCIFHILPADIFHSIQMDANTKGLLNIPQYVSLFERIEVNYKHFMNVVKYFCKNIYAKYPGINAYSISCSCFNYTANSTELELHPNQLIIGYGEEFYIVPEAREKWTENQEKVSMDSSNAAFLEIVYPYTFHFDMVADEIKIEQIDDIQFASQILYHIIYFIMDQTQHVNLLNLVVTSMDPKKKNPEFGKLLDTLTKHEKLNQFYTTFNSIYQKYIN